MYKPYDSAVQTKDQGHSSMSLDLPLNSVSTPCLLYLWKDFY